MLEGEELHWLNDGKIKNKIADLRAEQRVDRVVASPMAMNEVLELAKFIAGIAFCCEYYRVAPPRLKALTEKR